MIKAKMAAALLLALVITLLTLLPAGAASVHDDLYSDAPANPTQENVDFISAHYTPKDGDLLPCRIDTMEPTSLTVDTLQQIFDFVDINHQPPVRYFPEETQNEIQEIIKEVDKDDLYMPEFMSLLPENAQQEYDVRVDMQMNIDYREGQLVVVVLGRLADGKIEWKALPADATEENIIHYIIPQDVMQRYAGDETLFALLALKPGSSEGDSSQELIPEETFIPSKNLTDIIYVPSDEVRNSQGELVDCEIIIVPKTQPIEAELEKLTLHFTDQTKKPIRYFDEGTVHETALILKDTDVDTLLPYEITQVMVIDYIEPYGDVMAKFSFPTPFRDDQALIAMIGMPNPDGTFFWMPLHAEKVDAYIEITFSSSVLPTMMTDAGILLVMAEPFTE